MAQRQRRRRERQQLSRLCDLVAASLLPHLETKPPAPQLTREDERRILLALSRVNKAIRGWEEEEQGCEFDQEIVSCSGKVHSCCLRPDQRFDDGFSCLANIVSILVGFLGFCSDYVKHSAGNILIAISNPLMKFETVWIQFVELIWAAIHRVSTCVHTALHSTIDSSSCFGEGSICCSSVVESLRHNITISSTSITSFMAVLQLRCLNISGQTMASLFRVLHAILKFLKHSDCELKCDFICLSIHHIQKIRWDSYYQLNARELVSLVKDDRFSLSNDSTQLGILSGSLLQLLCSLVEQSDLEDTDGQRMYAKLVDVIPTLAAFLQEQHDVPKSLSQYSKHKILMVMMRLKPYMQQDCSHIVCWLKLLRQHFQDLLSKPLLEHIAKPENSLEGSPFLSSIVGLGEIQDKSTQHLQRQAMHLFLSCCICLNYNGNDSRLQCSCKRDDRMVGHKVHGCRDHCNCFSLSEISDWFQRWCLDKIFDSKSSTDIALCFLQLYMEEDDMLFSVLLQLLDAPLISLKIDNMETKWTSELIGAKLFSSIFDPVHIFHLLLSLVFQICYPVSLYNTHCKDNVNCLFIKIILQLHYDHLVLVDYLISKDVGVHCAQYLLRSVSSFHIFLMSFLGKKNYFLMSLNGTKGTCKLRNVIPLSVSLSLSLRCLRLVFRCWHAFVDDSVYEEKIGNINCKRQRTFKDINSIRGSSIEGPKLSSACDKKSENKQQLFLNAKVCLLSLKRTVEDLHKKDLFPYNPTPLLKSLARFEELCEQG